MRATLTSPWRGLRGQDWVFCLWVDLLKSAVAQSSARFLTPVSTQPWARGPVFTWNHHGLGEPAGPASRSPCLSPMQPRRWTPGGSKARPTGARRRATGKVSADFRFRGTVWARRAALKTAVGVAELSPGPKLLFIMFRHGTRLGTVHAIVALVPGADHRGQAVCEDAERALL